MNKSFRAILPADPSHESVSRPLDISSGDAATTPPPEWALKKRRRESRRAAAILVACNNCRQRKTRCDGRRPFCSGCASRKLQCCYVSSNVDETPHRALERRIESLQGHLRDRDELLERLRSAPDEEALDVLRRLRRTSDVSSALSSLAGSATGLDPPLPDMLQLQRSVSPPAYDAVDFGLDALQEPIFPSWDVSDSSTMDLNWLFATQDQWPTSPE